MAGKKGCSGGARPGAGRPKKVRPPVDPVATSAAAETAPAEPPAPVEPHYTDPIQFLMTVVNNPLAPQNERVRAAIAAAGYLKKRPHDGGKKEETQEKANSVAGGSRFAPSAPPKLARVA
jgi:phage terminase small subunit